MVYALLSADSASRRSFGSSGFTASGSRWLSGSSGSSSVTGSRPIAWLARSRGRTPQLELYRTCFHPGVSGLATYQLRYHRNTNSLLTELHAIYVHGADLLKILLSIEKKRAVL